MSYKKTREIERYNFDIVDWGTEDTITVCQKVCYNVLKKACEHAVKWCSLQKLERMQADILQSRDGDGADLVQSAYLYLLEYTRKNDMNVGLIPKHLTDTVTIQTREYDNKNKCYKTKQVKLIQALYKHVRSLISIEGVSSESLFTSYIEDYETDELDNRLYALGGYSRLYANDSPESNESLTDFLKKRKELEKTLSPTQLRVLHLLEVGGYTQSEIANKLHISQNSVKSAKREIREKAAHFWNV